MTQMRKIIAQRMIESRRTSAHVHCMFEVDITRIVQLRNKTKTAFEQRHGARLTFMPFFVRAVIIALQQFPIVNASIESENIRYHRHVNVGIAVALDWGLIVPVLKNADELLLAITTPLDVVVLGGVDSAWDVSRALTKGAKAVQLGPGLGADGVAVFARLEREMRTARRVRPEG